MQAVETVDAFAPVQDLGGGLDLWPSLPTVEQFVEFDKKHPAVPWLVGAGAVVFFGAIGFALGRSSARCR